MSTSRLYYQLKPYLPWGVRMKLRRILARRQRKTCQDAWPINESAGRPPAAWPGWPEGKKFAFVLTHDVEGQAGLAKCRELMQLDKELGFRACFNFIPEGDYAVPRELRTELVQNGFEVGVHDLHHDGRLYQSRSAFSENAKWINHYLKEWGATGFRSGFMLRNLDWLHELSIQYDTSTFDTDPFEPQPDGAGTIFPFWVQGPDSEMGYVELPYTLPQDSTLFVVLREPTPEIWLQKLDWIARQGGMALVNVHPDYIQFPGEPASPGTYPVAQYLKLLEHIRKRHVDVYWNALPHEIAELVSSHKRSLKPDQMQFTRSTPKTRVMEPDRPDPVVPSKSHAISQRNGRKPEIWIDLDNTPHVVFFKPIIDELLIRGFHLTITARDAFQVCELADQEKIPYIKIGRHYGKSRFLKVAGVLYRAMQLAPVARSKKPILSISHGARSQIVISNLLRIPTLLFADYEFAQYPPLMRPTWEMVPSVIPDEALCCDKDHIKKYPGIKEDVYVWKFKPDTALLQNLGLDESDLIITARPPATEAHYHNPESDGLFANFMDMACRNPKTRIVLLPRNKQQGELIRRLRPQWFEQNKTIIPRGALDGLNLIWHSDLLVSGGGTMNREAATLGVPVYSIFRGTIGAVDRHLQHSGRLILVETPEDVAGKIRLEKRARKSVGESTSRKSLDYIVDTIEELVEQLSTKNQRL